MSVRFRAMAALVLPVALMGCGGCGCASTPSPHRVIETVAPGEVIVEGTLTICSDLRRAPLEMVSGGVPAGTDILIGSDIATRLGLKVEFKNTAKAEIPASLSSSKCDIALSALEMGAPDTAGLVMMPYGELHQSLVVPIGNPDSIVGLTDLCGRMVGVIAGSDEEAGARGSGVYTGKDVFAVCRSAARPAPTVRSYATESDAEDALRSGLADALFVDSATGVYELEWYKDRVALIDNVTGNVAELGLAMSQGKQGLRAAVQKALDAMNADGSMEDFWFRGGASDVQPGPFGSSPTSASRP